MEKLNLPEFPAKVKQVDGKVLIFDIIRKKHVQLTPEEWVRQNFINYLVNFLDYPKSLIKVESGLRYNRLLKRSDILVFNRNAEPLLLVECKSPDSKISQNVVDQAAVYNRSLKARYILVTNGIRHLCWKISDGGNQLLEEIPRYDDL